MPTITCPECGGKSKFPDDSPPRRVKCPACGKVFLSTDGLEGPPSGRAPAVPEKKAGRSKDNLDVDDDRPTRRRRDDDDDDHDDRRASRRRRDDDDDDDRRPRRRDRDDDNDRDDDRPARKRDRAKADLTALEGQFNRTGLACLMLMIGGWVIVGGLGLSAFRVFLTMCGFSDNTEIFDIIAGMLGVAGWLAGMVGLGFAVSGPRDRGALGLSIAAACCGLFHLMLIMIIPSTVYGDLGATVGAGRSGMVWDNFVSQSRAIPTWLFDLIGGNSQRHYGFFPALPLLANVAEVGRFVLLLLFLRSVMLCAKDPKPARLCMKTVIGYASAVGGLIVLAAVLGIIYLLATPTGANADRNGKQASETMMLLFKLVQCLAVAGLFTWLSLVTMKIKNRIDYRA